MILMITLGLFMTLVGVILGGTVLELTLRAVAYGLSERPGGGFSMADSSGIRVKRPRKNL